MKVSMNTAPLKNVVVLGLLLAAALAACSDPDKSAGPAVDSADGPGLVTDRNRGVFGTGAKSREERAVPNGAASQASTPMSATPLAAASSSASAVDYRLTVR